MLHNAENCSSQVWRWKHGSLANHLSATSSPIFDQPMPGTRTGCREMKIKLVIALVALAATCILFYGFKALSTGELGAELFPGKDPSSLAAANSESGNDGVTERLPDQGDASRIPSGIGGANLRLTDSLMQAAALKGVNSQAYINMLNIASHTCDVHDFDELAKAQDPDRLWAINYLCHACDGFDAATMPRGNIETDVGTLAALGEEGAALEKAMRDLSTTDSMLDLTQAGLYLMERNKFLDQATYGLDEVGLAKAIAFAAVLRTCTALNACGSNSLFTASICATRDCPKGTTYAEARRLDLTPGEYAAAEKIRAQLSR